MQANLPGKVPQNKYCREMATAKKYDCDFKFYDELSEELRALQLWDEYNVVQNIKEQVVRIKEMTVMHAKSLDQDQTPDEKQVRQIAENIRQALISLDTSSIPKIIQKMDSVNGNSITRSVLEEVLHQQSGKYNQTITKVFKNIHNLQNRTQNILSIGLFYLINNQNGQKMINTYKTLIQKSLEELKKFKSEVSQIPPEAAQQIVESVKFKTFIEGSKLIYQVTTHLYDVFRIISGQSNLKFKLTNLKAQINQSINNLNNEYGTKFQILQEEALEPTKRQLTSYLNYLRNKDEQKGSLIKNSLCCFCMLPQNLINAGNKIVHINCWNTIKALSKK